MQSALQVLLPLTATAAPSHGKVVVPTQYDQKSALKSPVKNAEFINKHYYVNGYPIEANSVLADIAAEYRLDIATLRELNRIHIPLDDKFFHITPGEYVWVPDWNHLKENVPAPTIAPDFRVEPTTVKPVESANAPAWLSSAASTLSSKNANDAVKQRVLGDAAGAANQSIESWLNLHGNSRVSLSIDEHARLKGSSADVLLPLQDQQDMLAFTQFGVHDRNHYTTANIGAGQRFFQKEEMLGYNVFADQELRNNHTRVGAGVEYWRDYMKLAANGYMGVSSWKESKTHENYEERPASGLDFRAEAWLPQYPQLGGKLTLEQYFGNDVALISFEDRQRDPFAVTLGLNYTPIPFFTAGIDHKQGKGGSSDTQFNVAFNYQFGVPWADQVNPDSVALRRSLAGSRLDFVDRNYDMVMQYRKMEVIKLTLPERVVGVGESSQVINATVKTKHGLKNVVWDASTVIAAGGKLLKTQDQTLTIVLPNKVGEFPLHAIAYDKQGNASNQASTLIQVTQVTGAQHEISNIDATPMQQKANSRDVITYTLTAVDKQGAALKKAPVKWSSKFGSLVSQETTTDDQGHAHATVSSDSIGKALITAHLLNEDGTTLHEKIHDQAEFVALRDDLKVTVSKNEARADSVDSLVYTLTAVDEDGNTLADQNVKWESSLGSVKKADSKTNTNGQALLEITSKTAGDVALKVDLLGNTGEVRSSVENKEARFADLADNITLTHDRVSALANNADTITYEIQAKDIDNNILSGLSVAWAYNFGDKVSAEDKTDENGKAKLVLKSSKIGAVTVTADVTDSNGVARAALTDNQTQFKNVNDVLTLSESKTKALADGTDKVVYTLKAVDDQGKALKKYDVEWSKDIGTIGAKSNQTDDAGQATLELTSMSAGQVNVTATLKERGTNRSSQQNNQVQFVAVDYTTTFETQLAPVLADDVQLRVYTFTVKDALDNPAPNKAVTWTTNLGTPSATSSTTDDAGNAEITIHSGQEGTATVSAAFTESGKEYREVDNAGRFSLYANTTLNNDVASAQANGSEAITYTYHAVNVAKKNIANVAVEWAITGPNGMNVTKDSVTNASGVAVARITSTEAGNLNVSAKLIDAGKDVPDSAKTGTQTAFTSVTTLQLDLSITNNQAYIDGQFNITADVTDSAGTAVSGQQLEWSFETCANNGCTVTNQDKVTDPSGQIATNFTSTAPGHIKLKACLKDSPDVCDSVEADAYEHLSLSYKTKLQSTYSDGDTFSHIRLANGEINLQAKGGDNTFEWNYLRSSSAYIILDSTDDKANITLLNNHTAGVKVTTFKGVVGMEESKDFNIRDGKWVSEGPTALYEYEEAIAMCESYYEDAFVMIDEASANEIISHWSGIKASDSYKFSRSWLNNSKPSAANGTLMDLNTGVKANPPNPGTKDSAFCVAEQPL
jgi:adhesin/invasin